MDQRVSKSTLINMIKQKITVMNNEEEQNEESEKEESVTIVRIM